DTKSYSPANLISKLKFGDDKASLYAYLVSKGYGKIKPFFEANIIKKKAKYGGELPANISENGKILFEKQKKRFEKQYPLGLFWDEDDLGKIVISQKRIDEIVYGLGYRVYKNEIVLI